MSLPVQVAQWAHMHCFLSVVHSLDLTKKGENNSYIGKYEGWEPETLPQDTMFIRQFVKI